LATSIWEGQRVRLRAVEPGDWETYFAWNHDSEASRALYLIPFPRSKEAVRHQVEEMAVARSDGDTFRFQIETLAGELVGTINTHTCDPRTGTFSYGLAILPQHQRKGYASESIRLVLRYYFEELRYQKVTATVYSFNEPSIRLHERLGFQLEGRLRRMGYTRGEFYDHLLYGMTAEEFTRAQGR
jgi:RimJ/RimL family protein N-acetyltransferase